MLFKIQYLQAMSHDKEDSDFEVCLTSSEYNRILNVEKECKKQREQFRSIKQELQKELQSRNKEVSVYQATLKAKNQEIDQLTVECLRLKKLRLINEDEIRHLKEQHLQMKEANLSQLEQSVRQNKEMKEKRLNDESVIMQLKQQMAGLKRENISITEKLVAKAKQSEETLRKANEKSDRLEKQLSDAKKKAEYFEKKSQDIEAESKNNKQKCLSLEKQKERLIMINQESTIKFKEQVEQQENLKNSLEQQIRLTKEQLQQLVKEKDDQVKRLNQQAVKMNELLIESKNKIDIFLKQNAKEDTSSSSKDKFSARIYQALQWIKEGAIQPQDLKEQISNILTLEEEYDGIIASKNDQIHALKLKIKDLESINGMLSEVKVKKEENNCLSQNLVMKEEIEKLKLRLQRISEQYDEAVKSYNHTFTDMQLKHQKQLSQFSQLKSQNEVLKIYQKQFKEEVKGALGEFNREVNKMKNQSVYINPEQIMKSIKKLLAHLLGE